MRSSTKVLIVGAGGHAQVVADVLLAMRAAGAAVEVIGYVDDNPALQGRRLLNLPVLGPVSRWKALAPDELVVAVGDNHARARLQRSLAAEGACFFVARHPRSTVAPDVLLGKGTVVMAGVVVNTGSVIGEGVILNTGCTIDHHNHIDNFSHIAPGAHLAGEVVVGEGAFVGVGAAVIPQQRIGSWSVVGAGAVVVRPVPERTTVVGVPAKPLMRSKV